MSWLITPQQKLDPDAAIYIDRVEVADGQSLETGVRSAVNAFVVGCKADGTWDAIKACCILAGARTLDGCLVPLVGTAPTKNGTEGGWSYNRETGLAGNGTNNYLNSNRNNNADPQDNAHQSCFISTAPSTGTARIYMGAGVVDTGTTHLVRDTAGYIGSRNRSKTVTNLTLAIATGLGGHSRASSSSYVVRVNGTNYPRSILSEAPYSGNVFIFSTNPASFYSDARIAFYSIGEALDLALLDARVTALINAIAAAIP